ncbi:LysE family translocator [soil metagenome]
MIPAESFIPFITASVLLTISPGPDIIYVLVQSVANGTRAGVITTLGLVSGIIIHTALVAFGVSALIQQSENTFYIIKILGAAYLFFLAFKVWKSKEGVPITNSTISFSNKMQLFKTGFLMNVLNPKVTIFFLAFFPGFLWDPTGNTIAQFLILGILFMLQAFVIFGIVALMAGKISIFLNRSTGTQLVFKWVQIIVFLGIGIFILI